METVLTLNTKDEMADFISAIGTRRTQGIEQLCKDAKYYEIPCSTVADPMREMFYAMLEDNNLSVFQVEGVYVICHEKAEEVINLHLKASAKQVISFCELREKKSMAA